MKAIKFTMIILCTLFYGCGATTRNISLNEELHYDEAYDVSDKKKIVQTLVDSLLQPAPPLASNTKTPILVIYGITNQTSEHINTQTITNDILEELVNSQQYQCVDKFNRQDLNDEVRYQYGGDVAETTKVQKARQIGADFMMNGVLSSIEKEQVKQVRLKKKSLRYYKLHLKITDLETGLIKWADSVEIMREASKPFIGW